jgi:hypothetical protein
VPTGRPVLVSDDAGLVRGNTRAAGDRFDVVELAPVAGLHAPDYTVARLIYNLFGMISRNNPS